MHFYQPRQKNYYQPSVRQLSRYQQPFQSYPYQQQGNAQMFPMNMVGQPQMGNNPFGATSQNFNQQVQGGTNYSGSEQQNQMFQQYQTPYPINGNYPPQMSPGGFQSFMSQFKNENGTYDYNKMMDTAGQMMGAVNQISGLVKGFSGVFKS
ncbi:YppG family protein [Litchfieldia alkalitelluris]|uniref:YppG family protein n=1 Tax=Litchfieldia alkalitelluris TaxID=304268 RepID=UPI000996FD79|nr:YppG family protein [Litchfieldia alkalitelluris]